MNMEDRQPLRTSIRLERLKGTVGSRQELSYAVLYKDKYLVSLKLSEYHWRFGLACITLFIEVPLPDNLKSIL